MERWRDVRGVRVPRLLYGTAWKEERTRGCVAQALAAGFRGVDTANQRRHYAEAEVGAALRDAFAGGLARADVFVQTKFTFRASHDHRLPYDPHASFADQVAQSFASSLEHLGVDRLDAYLLHGPSGRTGLSAADREVWAALESLHDAGRVGLIGVSNVSADQLAALLRVARVRPAFVQNRCHASRGWDADVRAICAEHGVVYQGFSILTANRDVWGHRRVAHLARSHGRTPAQILFRTALQLDIVPLTGTSDPAHMAKDLEVFDFALAPEEVEQVLAPS